MILYFVILFITCIMNIQMKENGKIVYCDDNGKPLFLYNVRVRFSLWWKGLIGTAKAKIWWHKGRLKNFVKKI